MSSYFTACQRRLTKTLSRARPRPSILTATPADSRRPVNASAVTAPLVRVEHLGASLAQPEQCALAVDAQLGVADLDQRPLLLSRGRQLFFSHSSSIWSRPICSYNWASRASAPAEATLAPLAKIA